MKQIDQDPDDKEEYNWWVEGEKERAQAEAKYVIGGKTEVKPGEDDRV